MKTKTYINALVFDKHNIGIDPIVRESLKTFYYRNLYIDSVSGNPRHSIIDDSVDNCIRLASESNYDYLILTWEGNIFDISEYHKECINYIKELGDDWLVAGQIIDYYQNRLFFKKKNAEEYQNCFYLFPITALLNLQKWKELGKPKWGQDGGDELLLESIPSKECIHDNYTPVEIYPGQKSNLTKVKPSWNIINTSLIHNLPIRNLNNGIRNYQTYLYPENDVNKYNTFWQSTFMMPKFTPQYKKVFETLLPSKNPTRIKDKTWQCFIKNTEYYFPYESKTNSNVDYTNLDTFLFPSSGFKDFIVTMGKDSLHNKVNIIHFDILKECIEIKEKIINRWSGDKETFVETLTNIATEYRHDPMHVYHMHSMTNLIEAYDHMLKYFNNEIDLKNCWEDFQNLSHNYIEADILENSSSVIDLIDTKNIYICLSDIAGWRTNIMSYGYINLRKNISNCISELVKHNINGYVDYKDPKTDQQLWQTFDEALSYLK